MGRQKGDGGGRSKARPSSSSLAASLLPVGSAATVGFGGYIGSSRLDSSLGGEDAAPFAGIDGEMAQHLKRLARKDPTTKLKALGCLSVLLKQKSKQEIIPVIPQWAFEYKKLLLDYNREVRRATHETMSDLIAAVGRDLAPHLKSLMGPWWFSQFDPVFEVSQASKRSFQAAFPSQEKRLDALCLCATEICLYLGENLKLTVRDLFDKAAALDESEEMHQQVISSSLLALATLLDVFVSLQSEKPGFENISTEPKHSPKARSIAICHAEKLFSEHKCFLDFLKSNSVAIRSATFALLKSFMKNIPHVITQENLAALSAAILGAFQEKNPTCHPPMWDAIVLFSRKFPDCWTSLNAQKIVLSRLWHFLQSGCFGSQHVSYPALIVFLENVPPQAVQGDQFFLDLFKNLWAGRKLSLSSIEDRNAFFSAFGECFLWALQSTSRYFDESSAHGFRSTLVENILVKLLWDDFLCAFNPKVQNAVSTRTPAATSEDCNLAQKKIIEAPTSRYPLSYLQDLGKCIVEILTSMSRVGHDLLSAFFSAFKESFQGMLQHPENSEGQADTLERLIQFLVLMEQHAVRRGETWPLVYVVHPTLAECFPSIESLDSSDGIRFLSAAISVFGPSKIVNALLVQNKEISCCPLSEEENRRLEFEHFMQIFKTRFVPWCLEGSNSSIGARLDLLLSLLNDECICEQWSLILLHMISHRPKGVIPLDPDNAVVLSMLFQKVRGKIDSGIDRLHHQLLDSAAVAVASSCPPYGSQETDFLCSALGGSTEDDQISLLSRDSCVLILKEILGKLICFILGSSFKWVRDAGLMLTFGRGGIKIDLESHSDKIEMADFALEVLRRSFYCLMKLSEENVLVSNILAAIFILHWECYMVEALHTVPDEGSLNLETRIQLHKSLHAFRCKINSRFCKDLGVDCRGKSRIILSRSIRSAIWEEHDLDADKITSLCSEWMFEVIECFCLDQYEERSLLEELLEKNDQWPVWISTDFGSHYSENILIDSRLSGACKFVSFIDKLILKRGIDRVLCCTASWTYSSSEETISEISYQAWLVAEILCTWEWPGGNVIASFLPLLSSYSKSEQRPREGLLDSVFHILLDAALVQERSKAQSFPNSPVASADDVENIKEPFLRALLSLIMTLFNDNIWKCDKARKLFQVLINRLLIGNSVSTNSLRILPPIMKILILPLFQTHEDFTEDSGYLASGEDQVQDTIIGWLEQILSFPPLITWHPDNDMEEWFELAISCYPISATDGLNVPKPEREISLRERTLLLDIFRKQRVSADLSNASNPFQMLLSKIIVILVIYCSNDLNEEDWDFILSKLRFWIQSAVVMMEDAAENVNDLISTSNSSSGKLDNTIIKKLEQLVLVEHYRLDTAKSALLAFSSFSGTEPAKVSGNQHPLKDQKWESVVERIMEGILRIFLCAGLTQAISRLHSNEAASVIASWLIDNFQFWKLVAHGVIASSPLARERAVKSVDYWGLSKGSISSIYAILFSSKPAPPFQFAAYFMLSTEPVSLLAIGEGTMYNLDGDQDSSNTDLLSEQSVCIKEELSCIIERSREIFEMDFLSIERVHLFLAWSLILSHIWSLPPSSPARERLVQYIQNSVDSVILSCLFHHILDGDMVSNQRKKDKELPPVVYEAANAAKEAMTAGSLLSSVKYAWPIEPLKMASLAGAIFGTMLCLLPAYVREWFGNLRDRSASSAIESFTKTWCSPSLISNELSQIKKVSFADENFSVSVSKAANEVVATYTKEETGIDLVIRLPPSYPLRQVDVDCTRSLGISEVKQRKWIMSMMLFLRNQNGALAEAIRIWKQNFDKEFEGVEECPICYSVIHTANHSLPRLACKVCKHKFHPACIYKWFRTSDKSNCPLCQSNFL